MNRLLLLALALALAPQLPAAPEQEVPSAARDTPLPAAGDTPADDGIAPPPRGSIWRQTGPDGKPVFTDRPPPGTAEQVPLSPINQVPALRAESGWPGAPAAPGPGYQTLHIGGVAAGTLLNNPREAITISARPTPSLQPGHRLVILHNNAEANQDGSSSVTIARIARGSHTFVAEVRDLQGKVLISSSPLTFYVRRPSANNRN